MTERGAQAPRVGDLRSGVVGRDEELARVRELFSGGARVVTLVGPSGVGKSRIAQTLTDVMTGYGPSFAVLARLGGVSDASVARDEILRALPEPAGLASSPGEALWERCQGAEVLMVLDDVEVGAGVGALVLEMISGYPALRVVATSLRPIGVGGEQVVRIRPFPLEPDSWVTASGGVSPGVAVFTERARAADAGFSLGPDNVGDVARVCREVGGLPLAIELAASRVGSIEPAVMARQLAGHAGLGLLRDATRDAERHVSMESALRWSYELLGPEAQVLLAQLSVFAGPFDLEAAQAVAEPAPASAAEMLDSLSELVDLQLVDLWPQDPDRPRFSLPRLVRSFAARRLVEGGGEAEARSRHARHYRARCRRGPVAPEEMVDLLAAVDRATIDGEVDESLHAVVAAMASQPATSATMRTLQRRVDPLIAGLGDEPADEAFLARALIWSAAAVPDRLDGMTYAEWTAQRVRAAVTAARRSGDPQAVLESLVLTVRALPTTLDAPSALAAAAEGLVLAREVGDPQMLARFELYCAMSAQVRGDLDAMARLARNAWRGARESWDRRTQVRAVLLLHRAPGDLVADLKDLPSLGELLEACEDLGDSRLAGNVLTALADMALADGNLHEATRYAYRVLLLAVDWRLTEPLIGIAPLLTLVGVAAARGDLEEGVQLQASIDRFASAIAFAVPPETLTRYHAATTSLLSRAPISQRAIWSETGSSWGPPQASTFALNYARTVLSEQKPTPPGAIPKPEPKPGLSSLTAREREVLAAIATGASNKEIAERLTLSVKTVMHHSVSIYRKLGVRGRGEATALVNRTGILDALDRQSRRHRSR